MGRIFQSHECKITQSYKVGKHEANDIVAMGANNASLFDYVVAHSDGTVVEVVANYNKTDTTGSSYGNYVKIKHENSYTLYAHMKFSSVTVTKGQVVKKGQVIGYMGNTGHSFGAHVHFEVRNASNVKIDPTPYLNADLPKLIQAPTYVGYLDNATISTISGWAWNSINDTALTVNIKIFNGTTLVKELSTVASIYRGDLASAGKGNGAHGFNLNFDFNSLNGGTYTVKAFTNGIQLKGEKSVTVAQKIVAPTPTSTNTYSVQGGMTLGKIAQELGCTVDAIVSANKAKYPTITPSFIRVGWELIKPNTSAPTPNVAPTPTAPIVATWNPTVGDKVIVNGSITAGGNGGNAIAYSNQVMYIVGFVNANTYKNYIGVSLSQGGGRKGWANKSILTKI